jgi:VanZ family protein
MAGIYFFSSLPGNILPVSIAKFDKILHVVVYTVLAVLFYLSMNKSGLRRNIFLLSFVFAAVFGMTDELHQYFVPGRVASLGDIIADCVGALFGSYLGGLKVV